MSCDLLQEDAGALIDGELAEDRQVALFRHLESCPECRGHLDWLLRSRQELRKDRDALLAEAEALPAAGALFDLPAEPRPAAMRSKAFWRARGFVPGRIALPIGIAAALILWLAGLFVGTRLTHRSPRALERAEGTPAPAVVVVCGLPEVEVLGRTVRP